MFGAFFDIRERFVRKMWKFFMTQLQKDELKKQQKLNKQDKSSDKNTSSENKKSLFTQLKDTPDDKRYNKLPQHLRKQVDKGLMTWCKQHYVRYKGMLDCFKLYEQIRRIVLTHLRSKITTIQQEYLSKNKKTTQKQSKSDQDTGDIIIGDLDTEEK